MLLLANESYHTDCRRFGSEAAKTRAKQSQPIAQLHKQTQFYVYHPMALSFLMFRRWGLYVCGWLLVALPLVCHAQPQDHPVNVWYYSTNGDTGVTSFIQGTPIDQIDTTEGVYEYPAFPSGGPSGLQWRLDVSLSTIRIQQVVPPTTAPTTTTPFTDRLCMFFARDRDLVSAELLTPASDEYNDQDVVRYQVLPVGTTVIPDTTSSASFPLELQLQQGGLLVEFVNITAATRDVPSLEFVYQLESPPTSAPTAWGPTALPTILPGLGPPQPTLAPTKEEDMPTTSELFVIDYSCR